MYTEALKPRDPMEPTWKSPDTVTYGHRCWLLLAALASILATTTYAQEATVRSVSTPMEFQEAVRAGVEHVVVNAHLNMVNTPRFAETTIMDAGMIAIVQNLTTELHTLTIRGNCSDTVPDRPLSPPRLVRSQCLIQVREDFLETQVVGSAVWISDLYVLVDNGGAPKNHTTLIGCHGSDVYLTNMMFVGDELKARAIDAKPERKVYIADSHFSGFQKDRDGVIRLEPGATATIFRSTFRNNNVSTEDPPNSGDSNYGTRVAVGPVAGLKDDALALSASVWFQLPKVYDITLRSEVDPWRLRPKVDGDDPRTNAFGLIQFPRESDVAFERLVRSQTASGMPQYVRSPLPAGTSLVATDPYQDTNSDEWHDDILYVILAAAGGFAIVAIAAAIAFCCYRRRNSTLEKRGSAVRLPDGPGDDATGSFNRAPTAWVRNTTSQPSSQLRYGNTYDSDTGLIVSTGSDMAAPSPPARPAPPRWPANGRTPGSIQSANGDSSFPSTLNLESGSPRRGAQISAVQSGSSFQLPRNVAIPEDTQASPRIYESNPSLLGTTAYTSQGSKIDDVTQSRAASSAHADDHEHSAAAPTAKDLVVRAPRRPDSQLSTTPDATTSNVELKATYVFERTVVPDTDAVDISHDDVCQMLRQVHAARALFRNRYEMRGSVHQRLGGSGVTQFARSVHSSNLDEVEVAIKFFVKRPAFDRVVGLFVNSAVKTCMGAVIEAVPDRAENEVAGCVLPPCVVMKFGENLEEWGMRVMPNFPTAVNALCGIAQALVKFHATGHVYYALKPSNVAWFPHQKSWELIDFTCTARRGTRTSLSFSLNYAAPEVILAQEAGHETIPVNPAADVWALGVLAVELLTARRTFHPSTPTAEIHDKITGKLPLPWEQKEPDQLRTMRHSVMTCLERDPARRASAADVYHAWRNLRDFASIKPTHVK